jgi:hypothetical protein
MPAHSTPGLSHTLNLAAELRGDAVEVEGLPLSTLRRLVGGMPPCGAMVPLL